MPAAADPKTVPATLPCSAMPDALDGTATAALRRCPGCPKQVTARTARCPVCGAHAAAARARSAVRWAIIAVAAAGLAWWTLHR